MKSVIMLEGGSYWGIYTSGILDVFMEHDVYPDCVVGVSAGALNGVGYVAKQPGRCRDVVLSYGTDSRYLGTRALREERNLVGFDFILREMQDIFPFDEETFYHGGIKFYVCATNCVTGKQEYFDRDDTEDILTAVEASSSMPYICRKVDIGGTPYLDGGCGKHLPMSFLKEHPEYDRVAVILTRRLEYRKKPVSRAKDELARRLYKDYPELLSVLLTEPERYAIERRELEELRDQGRIFLIEPETELPIGRLERDRDKLWAGYRQGQKDGEKYWRQLRDFLQGDVQENTV